MKREKTELEQLCEDKGVTRKVFPGAAPDNLSFPEGRGFMVRLKYEGKGVADVVVPFYQGSAHTRPPSAGDVIYALILDGSCYENARDIDDFAADLGYDKVSETVSAYEACKRTAVQIRQFLGDDFDLFAGAEH